MWRTIQLKAGIARPVQLVLDMKVRWSSTLHMLHRAQQNKRVSNYFYIYFSCSRSYILQHIDTFINDLRWDEADTSKQDKIRALKLKPEEWDRVDTFLGLLTVCTSFSLCGRYLICYILLLAC
jgi:hypothetical protein